MNQIIVGILLLLGTGVQESTALERAQRFWSAPSIADRDRIAAAWLESEPAANEVYAALKQGRTFAEEVPRGYLLRQRRDSRGVIFPYLILIPENYSPDRQWPVRLDLHGGMGAPAWDPDQADWAGGWNRTDDFIMIFPAGWVDAMWWQPSQVENIESILREVRATWNTDENRVVAVGNSDGGAALFFLAMRVPDRFAGYAGFVAPPDRLVRAEFEPDGQMHVCNLARQRFHLIYGEKDRLVPLKHLRRYLICHGTCSPKFHPRMVRAARRGGPADLRLEEQGGRIR